MFELLLDMYLRGRISESYLRKAVRVNWITKEEMEQKLDEMKEAYNNR